MKGGFGMEYATEEPTTTS